jgi:hypothetical protein
MKNRIQKCLYVKRKYSSDGIAYRLVSLIGSNDTNLQLIVE